MSVYAIGDIQGCFEPLQRLLKHIEFDPAVDTLWFVGDLVNRGEGSLETLRFVRDLGSSAVTVLGNHDLHFLALHYAGFEPRRSDTLDVLLAAPDVDELAAWLRRQPLLVVANDFVMAHAGVPHIWSLAQARDFAAEACAVLSGPGYLQFFEQMYGPSPPWTPTLAGIERVRAIVNYLTRMRLVAEDGALDFDFKGSAEAMPDGFAPWFQYPRQFRDPIVFGHWAALDGITGRADVIATDTGCVWGRTLSAVRLDERRWYRVAATPGPG